MVEGIIFNEVLALSEDPGKRMVEIAEGQVGRWREEFRYKDEWCAFFVAHVAQIACEGEAIPMEKGYGRVSNLVHHILVAGGKEISKSEAKSGDIIVYGEDAHVEIIVKRNTDSTLESIGGNNGPFPGYVAGFRNIDSVASAFGGRYYIIRPNYV